jgi:DNA end-binding protein Ku
MATRAPAPSRATGSGTISFGLVNIPVKLYTGTQDSGIKRSEFTADGVSRVGRVAVNKDTGEVLAQRDIIRCIETQNGWVTLDDDEVDAASGIVPGVYEVTATVPLATLLGGDYVPQAVHQVRAAGKAGEKGLALLLKALAKTQTFALVYFSLRGKPRYGALLPTGRLYTLLFDEEVRAEHPAPITAEVNDRELELAVALVEAHRQARPDVNDTFSDSVRAYAAEKAQGGDIIKPAEPVIATGDASDLVASLAASLDAAHAQTA